MYSNVIMIMSAMMHHRRLQVHICRLDAFHANLLLTTFVHMFLYAKKNVSIFFTTTVYKDHENYTS